MRDRRGAWTSQGRSLLLNVLQRKTAVEVARSCHVTHTAIGKLARGETRYPDLSLAYALVRFSIDPGTWLQDPSNESRDSAKRSTLTESATKTAPSAA